MREVYERTRSAFVAMLIAGVVCVAPSAASAIGWSIQTTPSGNGFGGVSCLSAGACTAVGSAASQALAAHWNGTEWATQTFKAPALTNSLHSVSCTSAESCTAFGTGLSGILVEHWNGKEWVEQSAPNAPESTNDHLVAVSCTSAEACTAVGSYVNKAGVQVGLAERWNGKEWKIQELAAPLEEELGYGLNSVSCASATSCLATGSNNSHAMAETWNGTKWSRTPALATPTGGNSPTVSGVSCASATACTAVGYYNKFPILVTLAERWNGTKWTVQETPNPAENKELAMLESVSCPTTEDCTAVGFSKNNEKKQVTLAEHFHLISWELQATPNPAGASNTRLSSVSCASGEACTAVGYSESGSVKSTLAEIYH